MGGLFGGGSAKTDRGNQLAATQGEWNIFNYGLPTGEAQQKRGSETLGTAGDFFTRALRAGRTETAETSAPAINANLASADAEKRKEAAAGTGRSGGTAELNREASAKTEGKTADIINQNMVENRDKAAAGLEKVGSTELQNAGQLLGLSEKSISAILDNATQSRKTSLDQQNQIGAAIGGLLMAFL